MADGAAPGVTTHTRTGPQSLSHRREFAAPASRVHHAGVTRESLRFTDLADGRSALDVTSTFTSEEACDAMVRSGLDGGMDEGFDRLDGVLGSGPG
jgi:hypothetical protein